MSTTLSKIMSEVAEAAGTAAGSQGLPPLRAARAVDQLAAARTVADLGTNPQEFTTLSRDLFDWSRSERLSTKRLVRAAAAALQQHGGDPRGYSHVTELLGVLAIAGVILDADRLATLLEELAEPGELAYGPPDRPIKSATLLLRNLGHYQPERVMRLLRSAWQLRSGDEWYHSLVARRHLRRANPGAYVNASIMEKDDPPERLVSALQKDLDVAFDDDTARLAATLPDEHGEALRGVAAHTVDKMMLLARVPQLAPRQRPATPIVELIAEVDRFAVGDPQGSFVEKPSSWWDLLPEGGTGRIPLPPEIAALEGMELHDAGDDDSPIEVMRSEALLYDNAEHMGNCTYSHYLDRVLRGEVVIGRVTLAGQVVNFELTDLRDHGPGGAAWELGQIEGRRRAGEAHVAPEQRERLVATLQRHIDVATRR